MNWIPDRNRFELAAPPKWWLKQLTDFDAKLVVTTSRQHPIYLLARQVRKNPLLDMAAELSSDRDTAMLAGRQLVFVSTLQGKGLDNAASFCTWSTSIFNELRRRDITHYGGAANYIRLLEEFEAETREKQTAETAEKERLLDKEGYRHLKMRTGQRILNSGLPNSGGGSASGSTAKRAALTGATAGGRG